MARIGVVGLWHQGVVNAACLADMGHTVRAADPDQQVIARLQEGRPPVREPLLDALLRRGIRSGRLSFTGDVAETVRGASFIYIALDTPVGPEDEPEVAPVFAAARDAARSMTRRPIVVVTSQVPTGTCRALAAAMQAENAQAAFDVVYVPEFLRLGAAVETFRRPDRIVVGADDPAVARRVAALYRALRRPIVLTSLATAEMSKQASNSFLAVSISTINELADVCERVGADVMQVAEIMRLDSRIGPNAYLNPGLGFAGGTLGRDVRGLQYLGRRHGIPTSVMDAVMEVNTRRPALVGRRLEEMYGSLQSRTVAILGLTYKPGTSTLRRSVALDIIADLVRRGGRVTAFDPLARLDEVERLPPFSISPDPYSAVKGADAAVLVTPWDGLDRLNLGRIRRSMRRPVLLDTRNHFDPARLRRLGFEYLAVGRGDSGRA